MREITCGWELGDPSAEGWTRTDSTVQRVNTTVNLDGSGNGGSWALQQNDTTEDDAISPIFPSGAHREGWVRAYLLFANASADVYLLGNKGGAAQICVHIDGTDGLVRIRRGGAGGTVLATAGAALSAATYYRVEVHYFIDDSAGFVRVYVDDPGTYTTPHVAVAGVDTKNDASATDVNQWAVRLSQAGSRVDDIAVNSRTLRYKSGSGGVPTVGQTVTQSTPSAATGVIHQVIGTAAAGRLVLHSISGTFVDGAAISTPALLAAAVDAPTGAFVGGLEPQSAAPGPGYIVALAPNANGNSSQLSGTDGNSVDNYALVDDNPLDTGTDGVFTSISGNKDTYGLSNLPASAASVTDLRVVARALKDGTAINVLGAVVRSGGVDYESPAEFGAALPASAATFAFPFPVHPGTNAQWSPSEVNALEAGPIFTA